MQDKQIITITFDPKDQTINLEIKGVSMFKDIFGLLKHAEMQLVCQYNERFYEDETDEPDDDESLFQ